jgi:type IV secretory pathway TraG/TraD family ATPase VirD4
MSPTTMRALTHGTNGLLLAYVVTIVPIWVGLIRSRANLMRYLSSFLMAPVLMLIGAILATVPIAVIHSVGLGELSASIFTTAVLITLGYAGGRGYLTLRRANATFFHRRGAVVSEPESYLRRQDRRGPKERPPKGSPRSYITLADLPIESEDESKHFKFIGTTGTGKSTAIREILNSALARGDRAIIADPDGGYLNNFYSENRGDVILNPFEPDSLKWHLLGEITTEYDVDQIARSLIPEGAGSDKSWGEYARTFFAAVIRQIIAGRIRDDGEVLRLVTQASREELRLLLSGTPAGPYLEEGNERMFGSIRSVATSAVGALRHIARQRTAPFSVRHWVREGKSRKDGGRGGVLFLPYKAGEIAALRSSISAWMRIAIFEAMNRAEGDQRLWFVVDELDALGEIDGLKDALARLRKFGGRCILGFQSISQVSSTYGRGVADTIVENCGNTLILRSSASEQGGTAQFASKLIGEREGTHFAKSKTVQPGDWMASKTTTEQRVVEHAVMASEIERLPDLEGFLKFASEPDWMRVRLTHRVYPTIVRRKRHDAGERPAWAHDNPQGADGADSRTSSEMAPGREEPRARTARATRKPRAAAGQSNRPRRKDTLNSSVQKNRGRDEPPSTAGTPPIPESPVDPPAINP